MAELGVHLETCTNEASAAAMLGASISYPMRGAVTWKSIVGTNVAADALSNLSSPGVMGGAMIIIGEDYGEGASIIQERSYAYALKCSMWLLDPRPDLPTIVRMVEKGFELSEASHAPVMLELRIRACHVTGSFTAKNNRASAQSGLTPAETPANFDYGRLSHPPSTFLHEKLKVEERLPAAQAFAREHKLNEFFDGDLKDIGIIVLGGLYNTVSRALARLGLADAFGNARVPIYCLNLAYPLIPDEVKAFCLGKKHVLIVEEGSPEFVEQAISTELRRADIQTRIHGKGALPKAGEYTGEVMLRGIANFIRDASPAGVDATAIVAKADALLGHKPAAAKSLADLPPRPPNFCTGCPERPVFAALKLTQREIGRTHISTDIGCHSFATFAPFSMGNSILGYGMSLAAAAAVTPNVKSRPISVMGDGGFWHNGLITGVASNLFNKNDGVLIVMANGYTSATGQQYMPSSATSRQGTAPGMEIESTLRSFGVKWLRKVRTYQRRGDGEDPEGGDAHADRGPEGHHRGRRMPARAPAPRARRGRREAESRRARGAHQVRRRRRDLHRRPFLHPPVRLPVAHREALARSAAHRSGRRRDRKLRRLRPVRRGRACGGAVPVVLSRRGDPERECVGPLPASHAPDRDRLARAARGGGVSDARPFTLLIAALGGEGGGVLTDWIVSAAEASGLPVQSTSIPGVAQRTGATTYYVEIFPTPLAQLGGKRPVLALAPGVGDVDLVVASELLEAGRAIANGFVTTDRTLLIASVSRVYLTVEKMQMADGRYDSERVLKAAEQNAQGAHPVRHGDGREAGRRDRQCRDARRDRGLGPAAGPGRGLRGGDQGVTARRSKRTCAASRVGLAAAREQAPVALPRSGKRAAKPTPGALEAEASALPEPARAIVIEGVRRLVAYQDAGYARLYLDRLKPITEPKLLAETARHLAVRMSFEDVIRVAEAKISPERFRRIEGEIGAKDQPYVITEFLKPGIEELCQVLPPRLARAIVAYSEKRGWLGKVYFGMELKTTTVWGYARFWALAKLRRFRPKSWRYAEEQVSDRGVAQARHRRREALARARARSRRMRAAHQGLRRHLEARLGNYALIEARVIVPVLEGRMRVAHGIDAIASARTAALLDPEGEGLAQALAAIEAQVSLPLAAE